MAGLQDQRTDHSQTADAALWTWPELCAALRLPQVSGPDVFGISIDSRSLQAGDLFFALAGRPDARFAGAAAAAEAPEGRDGHEFLSQAQAAGAAGAVVAAARADGVELPHLTVDNTLAALWQLGTSARQRLRGKLVAVTGSSGKTTLKALLETGLGAQGAQTHTAVGSYNNHWGVPLTLARMSRTTDYAVVEVGTNHPGEIGRLSLLAQPDVAVLLNVLSTHIGNFAGPAALAAEKLAIADGLVEGGTLVTSDTIAAAHGLREREDGPHVICFGSGAAADVRWTMRGNDHARIEAQGASFDVVVPGGGPHRAETCAAALAVALALGLDLAPVAASFAGLQPPAGRGRVHRLLPAPGHPDTTTDGPRVSDSDVLTIVDDAYNANPVSMAEALRGLQQRSGRRIAVLGEMGELGADSVRFHRELAPLCVGLDLVIAVGAGLTPLLQELPSAVEHEQYADQSELDVDALIARLQPGDTVLIKGSNYVFWRPGWVHRLWQALAHDYLPM